MIEKIDVFLRCYHCVSLSLPLIERFRILSWLAKEVAPLYQLPLWHWDSSGKFSLLEFQEGKLQRLNSVEANDPLSAIAYMEQQPCGIFVMENLPSLLAKQGVEQLRSRVVNLIEGLDESSKHLIMLDTAQTPLSPAFSALIPQIQLPLPDIATINALISAQFSELGITNPIDLDALATTTSGLSETEIEQSIKWVHTHQQGKFDHSTWLELLLEYKVNRFQALGLNFVLRPQVPLFGGMDRLKRAIEFLRSDFTSEARRYNIPLPKGWLFVGPPGTGKSLAVKITALMLDYPLVNAEIGAILGNGAIYLENLIKRIEAAAPVVLWLDEFDKFFIGEGAAGGESGSSAQILGVLLNWLQEKRSKVFVIAALNRLSVLPPELTRSGRFDKIFYLDFPQAYERKEIFEIYLRKYQADHSFTEGEWRRLLNATLKCSGAEIFEIVKNAARQQYYAALDQEDFQYQLNLQDLLEARGLLTPLYSRDTDRIIAMENQAKYIAEPVSSPDESMFAPPQRSLWGD